MANLTERVPVGTGVVLKRDGHVLVGRRKGSFGAGSISLPGGKPNGGENPKSAAKRELLEETGIKVPRLDVLPVWTYDIDRAAQVHYVTVYFVANCPPDAHAELREPDKCEGWYWAHPDSFYRDELFSGAAQAIETAFQGARICERRWTSPDDYEVL